MSASPLVPLECNCAKVLRWLLLWTVLFVALSTGLVGTWSGSGGLLENWEALARDQELWECHMLAGLALAVGADVNVYEEWHNRAEQDAELRQAGRRGGGAAIIVVE